MQTSRRRQVHSPDKLVFDHYHQLLRLERERSERYNHFFVLFGIAIDENNSPAITDHVLKQLRSADYLFTLRRAHQHSDRKTQLGVLLPETDLNGAEIVKTRLEELFTQCKISGSINLVVYPDDGTSTERLLEKAFPLADQEYR